MDAESGESMELMCSVSHCAHTLISVCVICIRLLVIPVSHVTCCQRCMLLSHIDSVLVLASCASDTHGGAETGSLVTLTQKCAAVLFCLLPGSSAVCVCVC